MAHGANAFDLAAELRHAAPGATIAVPAGVHRGPFVLEKPVRLEGARGAVLEGDGKTNVVEIRSPDVELAGFVIRKSGADLARDQAGVYVTAPRAIIRDNQIVDCLHGIYLKATNDVRVLRNVIRGRAEIETVADPIAIRAMGREMSQTSSDITGQTMRRSPSGNFSGGRPSIGE
jgi:nitrous oxidase accessory protein